MYIFFLSLEITISTQYLTKYETQPMCPVKYIAIHGANLNKINRNRKMENMEKNCMQLKILNLFEMFRFMKKLF